MKKNNVIKLFGILFILFLSGLFFIKFSTNIYVGDYSYSSMVIDIQLKIDDKLVLDDSLHSSHFFPIILNEKLRYGIHKVNVSSKKAGVDQESKVFLLPNQYISIDFFGADTLYFEEAAFVRGNDSAAIFQNLLIEKTSGYCRSKFIVESIYNPFYTQ